MRPPPPRRSAPLLLALLTAGLLSSCAEDYCSDPDLLEPPVRTTTGALIALASVDLDVEPSRAAPLLPYDIDPDDPPTGPALGVEMIFTDIDGAPGRVRLTLQVPPVAGDSGRPGGSELTTRADVVSCDQEPPRDATGCAEFADNADRPGLVWWHEADPTGDPGRIVSAQLRHDGTLARATYTGIEVPADPVVEGDLDGGAMETLVGGLVFLVSDQRVDFETAAYMGRSGEQGPEGLVVLDWYGQDDGTPPPPGHPQHTRS